MLKGFQFGVFAMALFLYTSVYSLADKGLVPPGCSPGDEVLDCAPTHQCDLERDERQCSNCLFVALGRCVMRGLDPACEAARDAQNALYKAQKSRCEAQLLEQQASCELAKAALRVAITACENERDRPQN